MPQSRHFNFLDKLCLNVDNVVRALTDNAKTSGCPYPGKDEPEAQLNDKERKHAARLMRINHTGEICAQGLYHGQGVVSKSKEIQESMQHAMIEEGDHLVWCKQRLDELGDRTSFLNPFWYAASFMIGATAGKIGDEWSLGFVVETERQVIKHLDSHLEKLPEQDKRSAAVLEKMNIDEAKHRDEAIAAGARELPGPVKFLMKCMSKVMVKSVYYI